MPNQLSSNFTTWRGTPSGGVLAPSYPASLAQNLMEVTGLSPTQAPMLLLSNGDHLFVWGTGAHGSVSHLTSIHVTGEIPQEDYEAMLCRVACLTIFSHIDDDHITEACEALS